MNNDQFSVEELRRLEAKSIEELHILLPEEGDAILVARNYGLGMGGVDIAIWQIVEGKTVRRTVLASGPVDDFVPRDYSKIKISHDETIPRWTRIKQALAEADLKPIPTVPAEWVINESSTVDLAEFRKVKNTLDSLTPQTLISSEFHGVSIIYQESGNLRSEASWVGGGIGPILELAGIDSLSAQCVVKRED